MLVKSETSDGSTHEGGTALDQVKSETSSHPTVAKTEPSGGTSQNGNGQLNIASETLVQVSFTPLNPSLVNETLD